MNTYHLDDYIITANTQGEALSILWEHLDTGEPLEGITPNAK